MKLFSARSKFRCSQASPRAIAWARATATRAEGCRKARSVSYAT